MTDVPYTRLRTKGPFLTSDSVKTFGDLPQVANDIFIDIVQNQVSEDTWSFSCVVTGLSIDIPGNPFMSLLGQSATFNIKGTLNAGSYLPPLPPTQEFADYLSGILSGGITDQIEENYISSISEKSISDVPTKSFKKRIANGEIINNPVLNVKTSTTITYTNLQLGTPYTLGVERSIGNYAHKLRGVMEVNGEYHTLSPPADAEVMSMVTSHRANVYNGFTDLRQVCINSAFKNLNDGEYNYLEEIGESKETFDYLIKTSRRIANLLIDLKKGKWRKIAPQTFRKLKKDPSRLLELMSDAWLEARFALRPLVYSAQDAIKLHNEGLTHKAGRLTSNHAENNAYSNVSTSESTTNGITTKVVTEVFYSRKACAGVLFELDTANLKMRELGFTNLAGTLYELTFLSWLIDYFVSLDGALYYLTPNIGIRPLTAWASTDDTIKTVSTVRRYSDSGILLDNVEYSTLQEQYHREPISKPGFVNFNVDLDVYKITDVLALLNSVKPKGRL